MTMDVRDEDPGSDAPFDEALKDYPRTPELGSPGGLVDRAVWTLNWRVVAQPGAEPPAHVLELRDDFGDTLCRAPGVGEEGLWIWEDCKTDAVNEAGPKPWAEALGWSRFMHVVRVAPEQGMPAPSKLRQAPVSDHAGDPEWNAGPAPMNPFSPFPTPVSRPAQPEVGTVIGFTKVFREGGQVYSFAAIRATDRNAGWYLTGPQYSGNAYTWDALLDFIGGPAEWFRIGAVESWTPLGELR